MIGVSRQVESSEGSNASRTGRAWRSVARAERPSARMRVRVVEVAVWRLLVADWSSVAEVVAERAAEVGATKVFGAVGGCAAYGEGGKIAFAESGEE